MNPLNWLNPKRLIKKTKSRISGEIKVFNVFGRPSLEVGGLEQSGAFVGGIWKKGLTHAKGQLPKIADGLILGLGAGTVARLVGQFWPEAKITGIEIDAEIIKLARRYFKTHKIPRLKIVKANALKWLEKAKDAYDLILVDVYLGDEVPQGMENQQFLRRIKMLLNPGGLVIFNRLFYKEKKIQTEKFMKKLVKIFPELSFVRSASNLLILCAKKV